MKFKLLLCLVILPGLFQPVTTSAQPDEIARATRADKLEALSENLRHRDRADRQRARAWARDAGIPLRRQIANGGTLELQRLVPGRTPQFYITNNVDAADTVSTDELWPGGATGLSLDGSGMTVGEWDAGAVLGDHPDLYGRVTQVDGVTGISDHSTHVAGTLIGAGISGQPQARGMAYGAQLNAYDWNFDTTEMAAAAGGLLLSNHSYGIATGWARIGDPVPNNWWWFGGIAALEDPNFGYYDTESQLWDQVAANAPYYLIVKAAGNDRWDIGPAPGEEYTMVDQNGGSLGTSMMARPADCASGGYDCLPTTSVAKNILTIGAVDDVIGGYAPLAGPTQVQVTGFSGFGPTDDGRIKPDLVANGWLLLSTYGQNPYFAPAIGTSMAAPNVTGSLLLLQQHYQAVNASYMRAATLKALAIHTADESGAAEGPDYQHGWGLLNTRSAAEVISGDGGLEHSIVEGTLTDGGTVAVPFTVTTPGSTLKATLVWTDPPGTPVAPALDPPDSMLVNDLDLRISEGGDAYLPWILNPAVPADAATTGDNTRDNVEQVVVYDAAAGSYSIEVSHKGGLQGGANQDYALIISIGPGTPVSQGLVIDEEFSGSWPPAGWSVQTNSSHSWERVSHSGPNPTYTGPDPTQAVDDYAMINVSDAISTNAKLRTPVIDLSSATAVALRFNTYFFMDLLETINVDVSTDGGATWPITAWSHSQSVIFGAVKTVDLTASVAGEANVMLRFRFQTDFLGSGRYWQIDNVEVEAFGGGGTPAPEPPGQAENPNPANGSTDIGINSVLSWTPGALADSHDVYFDTDSNFPGVIGINQPGTSFDPGTLSRNTTYFWRVDSVNSDGTTPGPTWSFTTAPPGC
jgi:hypothetical protein